MFSEPCIGKRCEFANPAPSTYNKAETLPRRHPDIPCRKGLYMKILLKNGSIIDGTGKESYKADLLIEGGCIEAIGAVDARLADRVIDVQGKCVAPGFIDAHSHNDWFAARKDNARFFMPFLRQGITTQVTGNCGFSPFGFEKDSKYKHILGSGLFQFPDEEGGTFLRWPALPRRFTACRCTSCRCMGT